MTIKPSTDGAAGLEWFKSSYSSNEGPECVEVAASPDSVHIRDSKNKQGARLGFGSQGWSSFVAHVREADRAVRHVRVAPGGQLAGAAVLLQLAQKRPGGSSAGGLERATFLAIAGVAFLGCLLA